MAYPGGSLPPVVPVVPTTAPVTAPAPTTAPVAPNGRSVQSASASQMGLSSTLEVRLTDQQAGGSINDFRSGTPHALNEMRRKRPAVTILNGPSASRPRIGGDQSTGTSTVESQEVTDARIEQQCKSFRKNMQADQKALEERKASENGSSFLVKAFNHVVHLETGLARMSEVILNAAIKKIKKEEFGPKDLVQLLNDLGPIGLKLGQTLYMLDALPPNYKEAVKPLLNDVKPVDIDVKKYIEEALKAKAKAKAKGKTFSQAFRSINETPIGVGSIAQVYSAELTDGTKVAVKILKPGTYREIKIVNKIIEGLTDVLTMASPKGLGPLVCSKINEFMDAYLKESDFEYEQFYMDCFQKACEATEIGDQVKIPCVHKELSGRTMLVMDYIDGGDLVTIAKNDPLRALRLYLTAGSAWYKVALLTGFIHTDIQHGNFMGDGDPSAVCFIDWGRAILAPDYLMKSLINRELVNPDYLESDQDGDFDILFRNVIRQACGIGIDKTTQERVSQETLNNIARDVEMDMGNMSKPAPEDTDAERDQKKQFYFLAGTLKAQALCQEKYNLDVPGSLLMMAQNLGFLVNGGRTLGMDSRLTWDQLGTAMDECMTSEVKAAVQRMGGLGYSAR